MEYIVLPEIEIEGEKLEDCTSVTLKQRFNEHHEFSVKLDYDIIEGQTKSLSLSKAQSNIGKTLIIRFNKIDINKELGYEFKGIICEVRLEQSNNMNAELVFAGFSPTILLESGPDLTSFDNLKLDAIVTKVAKPASSSCKVNVKPKYQGLIPYICQYRESAFNFLNRLSSDFGEYFYYDGKDMFFGKPASTKKFVITHGDDVSGVELSIKALPVNFSNYSYVEKTEAFYVSKSPGSLQDLGLYSSFAFKESKNLFSSFVKEPSNIHAENNSDLSSFIKFKQASIAANMEILAATTYNPSICIGSVVDLRMSGTGYGSFLVVSVDHFLTEAGGYYNRIECVPSSLDVVPVSNFTIPVAETQIATVLKNDDKDKMGRVQVQMLWQKENNLITDWIRVMTPDAGKGDKGNNRGLVCIPEIGDQVMVGFRYNDPDRPFVLGSVFTGKTGEGGGEKNETKSFTVKSGSTIKFEQKKISIIDAEKEIQILFDGEGKLNIESKEEITLKCGESSINMKKDGTINIKGKEITIDATSKATMKSMQASFTAEKSGDAKMGGIKAEISGQASAKVVANGMAELSASGQTTVKGAMVMIN